MIYFDNAATTYPKPMAVTNAVRTALQKYGANPGRSGHKMSMAAAEEEYRCRVAAANLFHAEGPENVAFTLNCTHAINIVLKGLLKPGDHVVVSCLEHNAVMRPLEALRQQGVSYTPGAGSSRRQRRDSGWLSKSAERKNKADRLYACF